MTTASSPFAQGRNPRFDRLATRLAHWTWALFLLAAPSHLIALLVVDTIGTWPTILLSALLSAGLIGTAFTVIGWHVYALCPVCARKTPLDPQAAITEKRRPLRTYHWLGDQHDKALNRSVIALLILSFIPYVQFVTWPLLMATMAVTVYLDNIHMPLQPWCPQCDWDDEGDTERVPEPDPISEAVS
jgi:cytochrome c oxidase subunit IV